MRALIISVGIRNPFGHPNPEVLKRYQNLEIKVYRTDKNGAITITTDGKGYWMGTMSQTWRNRVKEKRISSNRQRPIRKGLKRAKKKKKAFSSLSKKPSNSLA